MKTTKKIGSIITASALVMLSAVPCFAATAEEVKEEVLSHSFEVYQIFSATSVEDEYLTDIDWGYSFKTTTQKRNFLNGLQSEEAFEVNGENIFAGCEDAEDTARVLDEYEDNSLIVKEFANYVISSGYVTRVYATVTNGDTIEDAGYYVFVDTADSDIINPTFIKMVANGKVEIEVKASVPQMEKKVQENSIDDNYTSTTLGTVADEFVGIEYGEGYNDVADYSVGDTVPFKLFGTMASTMDDYDTYYYAFHDELSTGLTYENDAKVSLYELTNGEYVFVSDVTSYFDTDTVGNTELTIACENVLDIPSLTATSILVVDYTATLNSSAIVGYNGNLNVAWLEYSNNPFDETSTGNTEEDKVIVFTYAINVIKTDAEDEDKKLADAEFYLMNADGKYYADGAWVDDKNVATALVTDKNGSFIVTGLDEGEYTLVEETAPKGYKALESEITVKIDANIIPDVNAEDAQSWTTTAQNAMASFDVTIDNADNAATLIEDGAPLTAVLEVINTSVFDLPGTGGMGTTLIYIAGAAFVALAVTLIVIKRRANA